MHAPFKPALVLLSVLLFLTGCAGPAGAPVLSVLQANAMLAPALLGTVTPVHDPSLIRQDHTYYVFSSDPAHPPPSHRLRIRCSGDKVHWSFCGQVFTALPAWIAAAVPGVNALWAPDISYFNGLYHVYYAASTAGSQTSVIALATNTTLNDTDPDYHWQDRGPVLISHPGEDFNAIDPNILVDTDGRVWLTYGSYWTGIKQREIDPASGKLFKEQTTRYDLAARPATPDHAIEGASLVHHGEFYYLFFSIDHCCEAKSEDDNYKEMVGRSNSPNGPFVDPAGHTLRNGGGSILLQSTNRWRAPGGGTAYVDAATGESLLTFHALDMDNAATSTLWVESISWASGWPLLDQTLSKSSPAE